jgi:hypothetical protein
MDIQNFAVENSNAATPPACGAMVPATFQI